MTTVVIQETTKLSGSLEAPPSKSYTHRAVIAASLATGESKIFNPLISEDTAATVDACSSLGAKITHKDRLLTVVGAGELRAPANPINCRESASTIRFLTPIAALAKGTTVLTGSSGLKRRLIEPLMRALQQLGVKYTSSNGFPPVSVVGGGITGGCTSLVGNVSSQFVSGLLFACPHADEDTTIELTTPLESKPYVELTLKIIEMHAVNIEVSNDFRSFEISSRQHYMAKEHIVPGDFSSSAFLFAAAAITQSKITVNNLHQPMPDDEIINILQKMHGRLRVRRGVIEVDGCDLTAIDIDARDIPDLVPPCAVLACFSEGETRIYNAQRLKLKESNRLEALSTELKKMGAEITVTKDGLRINGSCTLHGATVNPHNDHRIAMACAIAGLKAEGQTTILNAECVNKSYPTFFKDLTKLGANIRVR